MGSPKPNLKLARAQPLRPTFGLKLPGRFWAREGALGALKPHPFCSESYRLQGPRWLGYSRGVELPGIPKTRFNCGAVVTAAAAGWDGDSGLGEGSQD